MWADVMDLGGLSVAYYQSKSKDWRYLSIFPAKAIDLISIIPPRAVG